MNAVTPIPQPHSGSRIALRTSRMLGWQGFGAELVNVSAGLHRMPAFQHHRVGVHVGAPVRARCICNERRYVRLQAHGDANVIPAGLDGQWSDETACTIFSVWIGEDFLQRTVEQLALKSPDAQLRPQFQMHDLRFQHLAWALRAELEADEASDPRDGGAPDRRCAGARRQAAHAHAEDGRARDRVYRSAPGPASHVERAGHAR